MIYKPYYYQKHAEEFLIGHKEAGLFLDMGMGKSVITLTAIEKLIYDYMEISKVLVIAPLRPAAETWPGELKKWDHLKDLTWSLVIGSAAERKAALEKEADIYIINRENVVWLVDLFRQDWPFDMVVIDELSSFKSYKAQRFKALKKVRPYIDRIVGLTGTPASNGLLDLWPEVYLLDRGAALGKTISGYRDRYFRPDKRNGPVIYSWKPLPGSEEEIYKKIDPFCMSLKSEDWLDLPETLYIRHAVSLSDEGMALYRQMERDYILPFKDGDIDAANAAVLTGKLAQIAGGACYDENGDVKEIHRSKLEALADLVEEANGQPVIIYYNYRHELARIRELIPGAVDIKETGTIERWNRGELPVMLAHPASAGHGLNLQTGGHIIIWYSLPTSLELYQQANRRLSRPGQKYPVLIHHLLAKRTYDYRIIDQILSEKNEKQGALLAALKAHIKEVKG